MDVFVNISQVFSCRVTFVSCYKSVLMFSCHKITVGFVCVRPLYVTGFAKTRNNPARTEIHFIA